MSINHRLDRPAHGVIAIVVMLLMATLVAPGCGRQADAWRAKRPKTFPVTGIVSLDGSPVEGAMVTFIATETPSVAAGITDALGRFKLRTYDPGDGAIPGPHKVLIEKKIERMPASYNPDSPAPPPPPIIEHLLPKHFSDADKSPLTATVTSSGVNTISFDLPGH